MNPVTTTLAQVGLAIIPIIGKPSADYVRMLDDYLSVVSNVRYVWTKDGIAVSVRHAEKARQAMVDAHNFIITTKAAA